MGEKSIILDHDIGTNPDDFFTLLMLLNSSAAILKILVSGNNHARERAIFARKVLDNEERYDIESLQGENTGHIDFYGSKFIENFSPNTSKNYLKQIKSIVDNNQNVIWLVIQGLSNVAKFLKTYPEYKDKFEIIHMGMSIKGADNYIGGGTNMEADQLSAKYIYELNLKRMSVVGSHTTINDSIRVNPQSELYKKIKTSKTSNHKILFQHLNDYHQRNSIWPALHDPLAASVALGKKFVNFSVKHVDFNLSGKYKMGKNTAVSLSDTKINNPETFMNLMVELT